MKWKLDPSEVVLTYRNAGTSTVTRKRNFERKLKFSQKTVVLYHAPTGVEVFEDIPRGNYSKKEMNNLTDDIYHRLYPKLHKAVARHLRIPGQ